MSGSDLRSQVVESEMEIELYKLKLRNLCEDITYELGLDTNQKVKLKDILEKRVRPLRSCVK